MEQKKKHNRNIYIVLAVVLCLAGVFFVKDAVRAVEEMAYPRTYAALVQQYAAEYGVDENKVYAIIRTESGFKPEAESKVGARGLMQITDETFLWIKSRSPRFPSLPYRNFSANPCPFSNRYSS